MEKLKMASAVVLISLLFAPSVYMLASELLRSRRASISTEKYLNAKKEHREAQKKLASNAFNELIEDGRLQRVGSIDSIRTNGEWINVGYNSLFFEIEAGGDNYWSLDGKEWFYVD